MMLVWHTIYIHHKVESPNQRRVAIEGEGGYARNTDLLKYSGMYRDADKSLALPGRKKKLQRQKISIFIYVIYYHNWRNISTIYIYNETSIKLNIFTIKQNTGTLISP